MKNKQESHGKNNHKGCNDSSVHSKNSARILIVNDDPVQLRILTKVLIKHGKEVISCTGGKEALGKLRESGRVDLIIADLYMPEIDGWKLCRLLRSSEFSDFNDIPILIMSATFSGSDAENIARELGVNGFLSIPYNHEDLLFTIESILSGKVEQKKLRVLVVEDDSDLRETICEGLSKYGCMVYDAPDGKQGHKLFKEVNPEIVILDFHLPDNDGEHLLPAFKAPGSQASVILITGNPSPELAVKVTQMGADAYIRKPFTIQYLINLCEKIRREWSLLRAEKLLEERTLELQRILETSVDGIIITDPQGSITMANGFMETITGYPQDELIGKNTSELLPQGKEYQKKAEQLLLRLSAEPIVMGSELNWLGKNGTTIDIEINAALLKTNEGDTTGTIASVRDITKRKRIEAELRRAKETAETANRAKSEFLANMSHELRTPLNHIIGFTELVLNKHYGDLNGTQEEYLSDVVTSSHHLLSLINDILNLSKVETGKMDLTLSAVKIKILLEKTITVFQEQTLNPKIQLSLKSEHLPAAINADERKLKQILYNVLSNAIKFSPAGGKVCLSAREVNYSLRPGRRWRDPANLQVIENQNDTDNGRGMKGRKCIEFSIADTGLGIKPEEQNRIFEPFEQLDASSSKKYQGTGLGLSLTKSLVELHGGKIWVESEGEGKGSTFRFIIPV
jgi:PAS domain S-box-containing protein